MINTQKLKAALFTNIAPHYRRRLWMEMLTMKQIEFHLFYGKPLENGIREINFDEQWKPFKKRTHRIKNIRIRTILFYQLGVVSNIFTSNWHAVIFLGDMNIISTWIAAILAKIKGTKVYFWSHGLYGNESRQKLFFRKLFYSIADGHFLYGNYAKGLMEKENFNSSRLHVVYNSLDYSYHRSIRTKCIDKNLYPSRTFFLNSDLPTLVFIGRLTSEKKIQLLIEAVKSLKARDTKVNLLIIGTGREKDFLEEMASSINDQVYFYGPCYDELEIGKLLANADLCVSPGNVGLTAIHSLSFGTPVCSHNHMKEQGPEAEAILDGKTGILYDWEAGNLSMAIERWLKEKRNRDEVREACYNLIDKHYNSNTQVQIFKEVLLKN